MQQEIQSLGISFNLSTSDSLSSLRENYDEEAHICNPVVEIWTENLPNTSHTNIQKGSSNFERERCGKIRVQLTSPRPALKSKGIQIHRQPLRKRNTVP